MSVHTDSSVEIVDKRDIVFYGSSKNQPIVILKVGRILITKPCTHQVTSALAEKEHELAHEQMSLYCS